MRKILIEGNTTIATLIWVTVRTSLGATALWLQLCKHSEGINGKLSVMSAKEMEKSQRRL